MKMYTSEEANYLKDYYSSKVINKVTDEETGLRIEQIEIKKNNNYYEIICSGYFINSPSIVTKVSLEKVVEMLDLLSPVKVLKNKKLK